MEFFNPLRTKLKLKNLLRAVLTFAATGLFSLVAFSNGFSSELKWRIGLRGTSGGIPIPTWLVSCFLLLIAVIFLLCAIGYLLAVIKESDFKKMMALVAQIGDVNTIGTMLSSMPKSAYTKGGDLRFNRYFLFYTKGTDVAFIPAANIQGIKTEIEGSKYSEETYVCVYHIDGILKIRTTEKKVLQLLDELRTTFS